MVEEGYIYIPPSPYVVVGATLKCTMAKGDGRGPFRRTVSADNNWIRSPEKEITNKYDINYSVKCIGPFGICKILTALNGGADAPCNPDFLVIPWMRTAQISTTRSHPVLLKSSMTMCPLGGIINVYRHGQGDPAVMYDYEDRNSALSDDLWGFWESYFERARGRLGYALGSEGYGALRFFMNLENQYQLGETLSELNIDDRLHLLGRLVRLDGSSDFTAKDLAFFQGLGLSTSAIGAMQLDLAFHRNDSNLFDAMVSDISSRIESTTAILRTGGLAAIMGGTIRATSSRGGGGSRRITGRWENVNESMSPDARAFQTRVTGRPNQSFVQNGVRFDGVANGRLIEAKANYSNFVNRNTGKFHSWFQGRDGLTNQARRQIQAADGVPIDWYFQDRVTMDAVSALFMEEGISGINFIFLP